MDESVSCRRCWLYRVTHGEDAGPAGLRSNHFLSWPQLEGKLNALKIAMSVNDVPVIRGQLQELVSGYQPSGEVVDWVHMAQEREALANGA